MTEAERIDYLIRVLESNSAKDFAKKIGASQTVVTRIRQGQIGIRLKINAILSAYPAVNREWLETGEGYPGDLTVDLVKARYEAKLNRANAVIDQLLKQLENTQA